jgi:hypothetical protein
MTNWLTTHYPHPIPDDLPWHIYLKREHKTAVSGIAIGDRVFFYEFKEHKPVNDDAHFYPLGAEGIVHVATVCGSIYRRDCVVQYADGSLVDWCWGVPAEVADTRGFVHRLDVLRGLNYRQGGRLRGFGGGTGVKRLDQGLADALMDLFTWNSRNGSALPATYVE